MSHKFDKDRSVDYRYMLIPLAYPGIRHPHKRHKELVLVDRLGDSYMAAWRNNRLCRVGPTFLLKAEVRNRRAGFIFKDKFYYVSGIVW